MQVNKTHSMHLSKKFIALLKTEFNVNFMKCFFQITMIFCLIVYTNIKPDVLISTSHLPIVLRKTFTDLNVPGLTDEWQPGGAIP